MNVRLLLWVFSPLKTFLVLLHTVFCVVTGMIVILVSRTRGDWVMWHIGRNLWSRPILRFLIGAKIDCHIHPDVSALQNERKGVVLIANHASLLDINAAFCGSPVPIVFLSKASVRRVPLLGKLNELVGTVFVERGNRKSSIQAAHQLTKTLNQGRNVLVFPEGTRSKDGELMPFKKGAFHLAIAAGADIVPMHIDGTWERLPPSSFWIRPSHKPIQVRIGRPISTQHADAADVLLLSHQAMIELGATSND